MTKRVVFDQSPMVLLLILHRPMVEVLELVEMTNSEIRNTYVNLIENYYLGYCFGKYDLVLEYEPVSLEASNNFIKGFRKWIWETRLRGNQIRGCISPMTCYKISLEKQSDRTPKVKKNFNVRTYTVFRLGDVPLEDLLSEVNNNDQLFEKSVSVEFFWNPSTISYVAKASSDNIAKILTSLYNLREKFFSPDFCTFTTFRVNIGDQGIKCSGLSALINVKINKKGIAKGLMDKFEDTRIRLGYFDLIRDVNCLNLSDAFQTICKVQEFLVGKTDVNKPMRTGTVLAFDENLLRISREGG